MTLVIVLLIGALWGIVLCPLRKSYRGKFEMAALAAVCLALVAVRIMISGPWPVLTFDPGRYAGMSAVVAGLINLATRVGAVGTGFAVLFFAGYVAHGARLFWRLAKAESQLKS